MANTPSNVGLRHNLIKKVFRGNSKPLNNLCVTATGTGLGAASYKLGQMCLDSSSSNWFLCTATAGSGTWVKINA
jgi:hypothetical protein